MVDRNVTKKLFEKCGKRLWKLSCITATLFTTIWQLNEYCNGPEGTIVKYKRFHDKKSDLYPSVGICFSNTLIEHELKRYGDDVNMTAYVKFLSGDYWDQNFLKINYDRVTQNLDQYILASRYKNYLSEEYVPKMSEYNIGGMKCLVFNIPFIQGQQISDFEIDLRPDIFNGGRRIDSPGDGTSMENQLGVILHYPNQLTWQFDLMKRRWPTRKLNSPKNYVMAFDIRSIDVVQKIHKRSFPCFEASIDHDMEAQKSVLESIGCKPPYWNLTSTFPLCSAQEKMKAAASKISGTIMGTDKDASIPCRKFENIVYDYADMETPEEGDNSSLKMIFEYSTRHYKELKDVKNMELQTFIGNQTVLGGLYSLLLIYLYCI